jgi:hypothetical protein
MNGNGRLVDNNLAESLRRAAPLSGRETNNQLIKEKVKRTVS